MLRHTFGRDTAGGFLRCVAVHQAYDTKSRDTIAKLDVQCKCRRTGEGGERRTAGGWVDG